MERDTLIKQLRMYGNVNDLSDRTDEQLLNMIRGYVKKGAHLQHSAEVCPYFIGVSAFENRQWIIGCQLRKGCNVTPLETKSWASECALHCFKQKNCEREDFTHCRFYSEAQKEAGAMKQKYICKCGKVFEKQRDSDTTGYRIGADYGKKHECFGCHFILPITEGYPDPKVVDYECRASKKINYQTTADLPRSRDGFHVGRIHTLDMDFIRKIWEFSRMLDGIESNSKEMDLRSALYGADGRYGLTIYVTKTKAGIAASSAISDKFFAGGSFRPGITAEQEKQLVMQQIRQSKLNANTSPAALTSPANDSVSNGVQSQRSIDQITVEINFYKEQTAQNIIEIGKRLIEAKQQLQHGEWLPWLRDKVDFTERSAQNFMKIAQEYSKTQPVSYLPYTKLLALLQVPDEDREEFLHETHLVDGQEKTVDEMSKRELQQAIKERDDALKNEKQARDQYLKAEKIAENLREENKEKFNNYLEVRDELTQANKNIRKWHDARQCDLQRITELETQIKQLESRPIDVAVREPSEAEKERLREEGAAAVISQAERTKQIYERRLNEVRSQLEEAKKEARNDMGLEPDEIVSAAASFRNSLDSIFDNFLLILRISPANSTDNVVRECVEYLRGMITDLEDSGAVSQNIALMDNDLELPPEDGMEG